MEELIASALDAAGDLSGARRWLRAREALAEGLTLVVVGADERSVREVCARRHPGVRILPVELTPGSATSEGAARDALLGAHAALWATPAARALSASERDAIAPLADALPARSALVVTGAETLSLVTDDPLAELSAVWARVASLCPPSLPLTTDPIAWVDAVVADGPAVLQARRREVGRVLLRDARLSVDARLCELERADTDLASALAQREEQTERERSQAASTARHVLGAVARHTERLLAHWSLFIRDLERALPEEIAAIPDPTRASQALPPWIAHVTEQWLTDATSAWEDAVRADLEGIAAAEWRGALHLVAPATSPVRLGAEPSWRHRLVVTGALGGGTALAVAGWWTPGLTLAAGGALLAATRAVRGRLDHAALAAGARDAVQQIGQEASRGMEDQLARVRQAIARVQTGLTEPLNEALEDLRRQQQARRSELRDRVSQLTQGREALDAQLDALQDDS